MVTEKPLPVDVATFNALKQTLKFNSRYTQNDAQQNVNILQMGCDSAVLAAEERVKEIQRIGGTNGTVNGVVRSNRTAIGIENSKVVEQGVLKCLMGACN